MKKKKHLIKIEKVQSEGYVAEDIHVAVAIPHDVYLAVKNFDSFRNRSPRHMVLKFIDGVPEEGKDNEFVQITLDKQDVKEEAPPSYIR